MRHGVGLFVLAACLHAPAQAQTHPLNDTGITWSGHATSGNATTCDPAHPAGQDCHYGSNTFNFTALDASGQPTTPSSGATPHPCVRDNVTGLVWEVKTDDGGLHDKDWTYTWYNSNPQTNGGYRGTANGGTCYLSLSGRCDTEKYVQDINAEGWCGYRDWRMPTRLELQDIVDYGHVNPSSINQTFFPNTPSSSFWTGSTFVSFLNYAWGVDFGGGWVVYLCHQDAYRVRLVRG